MTKVGIFRSSCFTGSMIPGVVLVFVANTRNGPLSHGTELCQESVLSYFNFFTHFCALYCAFFVCVCVWEQVELRCLSIRMFDLWVVIQFGSICGAWHKIRTYSRCDTSVYIPCAVMRTVPCTCVLQMARKRRGGEGGTSEGNTHVEVVYRNVVGAMRLT